MVEQGGMKKNPNLYIGRGFDLCHKVPGSSWGRGKHAAQ